MECYLHNDNPCGKNLVCISSYNDVADTSIQGNFLPYMKSKKYYINDEYIGDHANSAIINFEKVGKCVKKKKEIGGFYKKGFILDRISSNTLISKDLIVTNFNTKYGHVEENLEEYLMEVLTQHHVQRYVTNLVPRIISVNIFNAYLPNSSNSSNPKTKEDCKFSLRPVIQKVEENVISDEFKFIDDIIDNIIEYENDDENEDTSYTLLDMLRIIPREVDPVVYDLLKLKYKEHKDIYLCMRSSINHLKSIPKIDSGDQLITDLEYVENLLNPDSPAITDETEKYRHDLICFFRTFVYFNTPAIATATLNLWWQRSGDFINNFFVYLHRLHSINVFHRDLKEDNILVNINTFEEFKFIDFGYSGTVANWMSMYDQYITKDNSKFFKLYTEVYNYFNNLKNKYKGINYSQKPSDELLQNLMLCELCNFDNMTTSNTTYETFFFPNSVFKDFYPSSLFLRPYNEYKHNPYLQTKTDQFLKIIKINDTIKRFIADKYAEAVNKFVYNKQR